MITASVSDEVPILTQTGARRGVALRTPPVRRWLRGSGTRWMRAFPTFTSHATKRAPPRPALMILDWRSPSKAQLSA